MTHVCTLASYGKCRPSRLHVVLPFRYMYRYLGLDYRQLTVHVEKEKKKARTDETKQRGQTKTNIHVNNKCKTTSEELLCGLVTLFWVWVDFRKSSFFCLWLFSYICRTEAGQLLPPERSQDHSDDNKLANITDLP